jgi:hypothetical protein
MITINLESSEESKHHKVSSFMVIMFLIVKI